MQDMDVRNALRCYVSAEEPPARLGSTEILAAARRSQRARTTAALASAGLAGALLVAGVAAVPGLRSSSPDAAQPGDGFTSARPCATAPGPAPAGPAADKQPLSKEQAAWARAKLTCYLAATMPRLLPDARYAKVPFPWTGEPLTAVSRSEFPQSVNRVDAFALVRDARGTGDLTVIIEATTTPPASQAAEQCRQWSFCTVRTGPNGETVVLNQAPPDPKDGVQSVSARVYRGHTCVSVEASNSDRGYAGGGAPAATRDRPILSADQVVELASSPELYLFP
jgi:hypothetical protein